MSDECHFAYDRSLQRGSVRVALFTSSAMSSSGRLLLDGLRLPLLLLFCLAQTTQRPVAAVQIDNGVLGQPTISCGTDRVDFWVRTEQPFNGKVYVKGEYGNEECTKTFTTTGGIIDTTPSTATVDPGECQPCPPCVKFSLRRKRQVPAHVDGDPRMAHLSVQLGTCNAQRDRTLTPPGVTVSFTVVVSFHEHFVTKVDRAYKIQCAYMESDRTVTSEIDVSMPSTTEIIGSALMPVCSYTIRRDSPDGYEIRFAKVGDKVYHRWECSNEMPGMFGMLVHDCYVEDGRGQRVPVLDTHGCSEDQFVLPDLTYERGVLLAYVEAHVFKFADRAVLDFQCAMTVCVRADGGCDGLTPPLCERSAAQQRLRRAILRETIVRNRTVEAADNEWRLHAQRVTVVDLDEDISDEELLTFEKGWGADDDEGQETAAQSDPRATRLYQRLMGRADSNVCLSVTGFGILVALCTFVFTVASVILATVFLLRRGKL